MAITLYQISPSLCSQKVRLALEEKGVDWTPRPVDIGPRMENYEPWYARLNPRMVVPTLDHDGHIVTDSARIVRYVDTTLPGPSLTPAEPDAQEEMARFIALQDAFPVRELSYGRMPWPLGGIVRGRGMDMRLARLRQMAAENPDLAEAYEARVQDVLDWRVVSADPAQVRALEERLATTLDEAERALAQREWLAGRTYSLADLTWTVFVARLHMLRLGALVEGRPKLAAWYARVKARPSFAAADLWEKPKPSYILKLMAPVFLPKILMVVGLLIAAVVAWRVLT